MPILRITINKEKYDLSYMEGDLIGMCFLTYKDSIKSEHEHRFILAPPIYIEHETMPKCKMFCESCGEIRPL